MCVCGGICREGGTPSSAAGRRRVPTRRPPPAAPRHDGRLFCTSCYRQFVDSEPPNAPPHPAIAGAGGGGGGGGAGVGSVQRRDCGDDCRRRTAAGGAGEPRRGRGEGAPCGWQCNSAPYLLPALWAATVRGATCASLWRVCSHAVLPSPAVLTCLRAGLPRAGAAH
jgi:hypothetical protein